MQSGELVSGYVMAASDTDGRPFLVEALESARQQNRLVMEDHAEGDPPVLVAAAPVSGGGSVFAFQRVVAGRETRSLRLVGDRARAAQLRPDRRVAPHAS